MSDHLFRAVDEMLALAPPGPSAGQLRDRLRRRRRNRSAMMFALSLLVIVNGLVVIGARSPSPVRPASPADVATTFSPTILTADPTTAPPTSEVVFVEPLISEPATTVPHRPPLARNDLTTIAADSTIDLMVLANDVDPDAEPLRLISVGEPTAGTVSILTDSQVRFTPPLGFVGVVTFDYSIADESGLTAIATVTIVLTAAPETGTPQPP